MISFNDYIDVCYIDYDYNRTPVMGISYFERIKLLSVLSDLEAVDVEEINKVKNNVTCLTVDDVKTLNIFKGYSDVPALLPLFYLLCMNNYNQHYKHFMPSVVAHEVITNIKANKELIKNIITKTNNSELINYVLNTPFYCSHAPYCLVGLLYDENNN